MKSKGTAALAIAVVLGLLSAGIAALPESSSDGEVYGKYGALFDFSYTEFDAAFKSVTGKNLEEWVDDLSHEAEPYGYSFHAEPDLETNFAVSRDTVRNGKDYTMTDRIVGSVNFSFKGEANGRFPIAGTYYPNEGETSFEFFTRIFTEDLSPDSRDIHANTSIDLYVDLLSVTHVDLATGDMTDSHVELKIAMYEKDDRNISFTFDTDDNFDPVSATIGYDQKNVDSNIYLDFAVRLTMDGMRVFTDETSTWSISPVTREHVEKSVISSDLANSIWAQFIEAQGEETDGSLPELILELIGSGGRMLDLFDTIKSLTSTDVPDASIRGDFDANNTTDSEGYEYCEITLKKDDGTPGETYEIPKAGYVLKLGDMVLKIPDYLLSNTKKEALRLVLIAIGWNDIDVRDISNDQATQARISEVSTYVDDMIVDDDIPSYTVPIEYSIAAVVGIALSAILMVLVRRRII